MKPLFFVVLVLCASAMFAAPLQGGFAQAPTATASPEEKDRVFLEARYKVIEAAVKYENTPYRYGGLTKSGLDCSGFIYLSFKDALGISTPRSSSGLYSWVAKISLENAQPGDLLFFKTDGSGNISHVALYLGDRHFIHSASAGPKTGVIISTLDERYWARSYAGAGRAFPESQSGFRPVLASANSGSTEIKQTASNSSWGGAKTEAPGASATPAGEGRLLLGAAIAPTWGAFLKDGGLVRGVAGQLHLIADTYSLGPRMFFGLQVRPEYDHALGVFRLPITLSWGPSDQIMIFAGPVFSFGSPTISTAEGDRSYKAGSTWLGAIGVTAAPFNFKTTAGEFSPYIETAWQYYIRDEQTKNTNADFSAGFRFSTGVRWAVRVR